MEQFDSKNHTGENLASKYEADESGFVRLGDIALGEFEGLQSQYLSYYVEGRVRGYPKLGEDIRFEGHPTDWHQLRIHRDDVEEFVSRVKEYKSQ
ncbi:MAG: hypothetical protein ACI9BF_000820 [Candidatus Paceibacteria bacterium]|jgi:hypothetical protein